MPLFVFAHSMGSMIWNTFLINNPHLRLGGYIMSAPLLDLGFKPSLITEILFLKVLKHLREMVMHNGPNHEPVSRIKRVQMFHQLSPLMFPLVGGP